MQKLNRISKIINILSMSVGTIADLMFIHLNVHAYIYACKVCKLWIFVSVVFNLFGIYIDVNSFSLYLVKCLEIFQQQSWILERIDILYSEYNCMKSVLRTGIFIYHWSVLLPMMLSYCYFDCQSLQCNICSNFAGLVILFPFLFQLQCNSINLFLFLFSMFSHYNVHRFSKV